MAYIWYVGDINVIWIVACFTACYTTCVHILSTSKEWCLLCPLAKGVSKPKFFSLPSFPWTLLLVFFFFFYLSLYLLPHETYVKNAATNNPPSFHFLPKEFTVFKHQCFSKYPSSMWMKKGKFKLSFFSQGHSAEIISCSFNTNGDQLLTGSFDHTVSVWDTRTGR